MNKAILVCIFKNELDMIRSGLKKLDFRGTNTKKWKVGMTIYYVESGDGGCLKVLAEAVIGEKYNLTLSDYQTNMVHMTGTKCFKEVSDYSLQEIGYAKHPHAFELENIKFYDKPINTNEFMLYSTFIKWCNNTIDIKNEQQMRSNYNYADAAKLFRVDFLSRQFTYVVKMEEE